MSGARERGIEWPTIAVAAGIYAGFALLTLLHEAIPGWALAIAGGYVVAWHGSLQHEVVHGHPTPWRRVNEALVWPSLWLWLPYPVYRASHARHHATAHLTDPERDPESYYLRAATWRGAGRWRRAFWIAHNTLLGRLALGPPVAVARLLAAEVPRVVRGEGDARRVWAVHALGCAAVLGWAAGVCAMPVATYLAAFVYPGLALTLLRSFAEHRAHADPAGRTAVIEAGPVLALLYLNNNLHAAHHAEPGLAWYRLPARWREMAGRGEGAAGERFGGYAEIAARYLVRPKEPVAHPLPAGAG